MSALGAWLAGGGKFAILGSVYLREGVHPQLGAHAYAGLMALGACWLIAVAGAAAAAWRRDRFLPAAGVLYGGVAAWMTLAYPPTTDEPHYLTLAESLAWDGDIRLAREYGEGAYRKFYPADAIDPHVVIAPDGEMYAQHTLGLPALLLPGYAAAGRWGAAALAAGWAVLLLAGVLAVCRARGVPERDARTCAALLATTAPLLLASTTVFTEVPAAALLAFGLAGVLAGPAWTAPAAGALLPWLHPRYALLSLGLAAARAAKGRPRPAEILGWAVAGAASAALFLAVYRGPALTAVLNVLTEQYPARLEDLSASSLARVAFGNPFRGFAGKLLDRDFGVLPYAPWLAVAAWRAFRRPRARTEPAFWLVGTAYLAVSCLFRNWHGSSYPGRTPVPLLPLAAPLLARGAAAARAHRSGRRWLAAAVAVSWAVALVLTACPVLRYTSGHAWLASHLGKRTVLLPPAWFPSFR